jgi:hypothetical protein
MKKESIKQNGLLWRLAQAQSAKRLIPKPLKVLGRRLLPLESYDPQRWLAEDPYADVEEVSSYPGRVDVTLGIIKEFTRIHSFYIGACRELGVPYKVIDISGPDWVQQIQASGCDAFLVRPSGQITVWKQMFDERLKVISQDLGKTIFPSYEAIWFYESKRRMHYWLQAHDVAHPRTWVYYDRQAALSFADVTPLPIVFKTDFGSGAMGVQILTDRRKINRLVNRCFRHGIVKAGGDPRDRQWGSVLFQEYLPNVREWRMIRMGESYMGFQKLRRGQFHSGSHEFLYQRPPERLLNWVRETTDKGSFRSMALDIFVREDGDYLVNELQTTFALHADEGIPMVDGETGRFLYDEDAATWRFEPGNFCRNKLCNLRVEALLQQFGVNTEDLNSAQSARDTAL